MRPLLSMQKSMLAVLMLLFALPACIIVVEEDDEHDDYFHGHGWQLEVIFYHNRTLTADDPYTITFQTDGRLEGRADCNGYNGTYEEPREGILSIREIRSIGNACGGPSLEDRYFEVLSSAVSYRVRGDNLIVTARNGDTLQFYKD
ncbi:MAG: META domain-containing protein [Rhodothermales bacterium]